MQVYIKIIRNDSVLVNYASIDHSKYFYKSVMTTILPKSSEHGSYKIWNGWWAYIQSFFPSRFNSTVNFKLQWHIFIEISPPEESHNLTKICKSVLNILYSDKIIFFLTTFLLLQILAHLSCFSWGVRE